MMISFIGVCTLAVRHSTKAEWRNKDLPMEVSGSRVNDLDFTKMLIN